MSDTVGPPDVITFGGFFFEISATPFARSKNADDQACHDIFTFIGSKPSNGSRSGGACTVRQGILRGSRPDGFPSRPLVLGRFVDTAQFRLGKRALSD